MKLCIAHTEPINPPSASPKLSRAQVWAGLKRKARDPVRFIPVIQECDVVEEQETGLLRIVSFKPGTGPPGKVKEKVNFVEGVRVDFHMIEQNTYISNIISSGSGESDLYLIFTYEWDFPDLEEGTPASVEKQKQYEAMAKGAVASSIAEIREGLGDD